MTSDCSLFLGSLSAGEAVSKLHPKTKSGPLPVFVKKIYCSLAPPLTLSIICGFSPLRRNMSGCDKDHVTHRAPDSKTENICSLVLYPKKK